jgi:hypothetical protein
LALLVAGNCDRSGHLFRHIVVSVGLSGRRTERPPGLLFPELLEPVLHRLGPLPGTALAAEPLDAPVKQTTRLVRVACPVCGYVVRVAQKWLGEKGPPHCPEHGPMAASAVR